MKQLTVQFDKLNFHKMSDMLRIQMCFLKDNYVIYIWNVLCGYGSLSFDVLYPTSCCV